MEWNVSVRSQKDTHNYVWDSRTLKESGAAGSSKDSVNETLYLLEGTVEHEANSIVIYVFNGDGSALI